MGFRAGRFCFTVRILEVLGLTAKNLRQVRNWFASSRARKKVVQYAVEPSKIDGLCKQKTNCCGQPYATTAQERV